MNKKKADHIEIILAFIIFISFILFALYFFNPSSDRSVDSSLSFTFNEIERNISTELKTYSVKLNIDKIGGPIVAVEIDEENGKNVIVENYYGKKLDSSKSGDKVWIKHENYNFTFIKLSEDISVSNKFNSVLDVKKEEYNISSVISDKLISEKRVIELNRSYYSDYERLKAFFNIPRNSNFAFILEFDGKKIIGEKNIPSSLDVYSDNKRVKILNKDGGTSFGYLTIKIW
jgi:hypothetical protein